MLLYSYLDVNFEKLHSRYLFIFIFQLNVLFTSTWHKELYILLTIFFLFIWCLCIIYQIVLVYI